MADTRDPLADDAEVAAIRERDEIAYGAPVGDHVAESFSPKLLYRELKQAEGDRHTLLSRLDAMRTVLNATQADHDLLFKLSVQRFDLWQEAEQKLAAVQAKLSRLEAMEKRLEDDKLADQLDLDMGIDSDARDLFDAYRKAVKGE